MFHYSIAKYVDNIIVNESINVGIIVSVPNTNKYIGKFIEIDKLKNIYPHANLNLLKKVIETFKKYKSSSSLSDLNKFTNQLQFTSPHVRDASDINTALNELFDKFVVIDNNFPTPNIIEFNPKITKRYHGILASKMYTRSTSRARVPYSIAFTQIQTIEKT